MEIFVRSKHLPGRPTVNLQIREIQYLISRGGDSMGFPVSFVPAVFW